MKKRLLTSTLLVLSAMFMFPLGMRGQTITFGSYSDKTADGAADNLTITTESGFGVYLDGGNKSKISAKSLTFVSEGATTANDKETFAYQYNPGGQVSKTSGERSIKFTIPKAGKLYVYPRISNTGSSSNLYIQQNGSTLVTKLICESSYALGEGEQYYTTTIAGTTYYNSVECSVNKGDAYITTGSTAINFSAFKFVANTYTVLATSESGGTITVKKGSDDVTTAVATGTSYEVETSLTLTASPNDGFHFVGWKSGDTTISTSETYNIECLSANTVLVAVFAKDTYALTSSTSGTGSGTITLRSGSESGDVISSGTEIEWGTNVYVSASAGAGSTLTSLIYGGTTMTNNSTFEMPKAATSVAAVFDQNQSISVTASDYSGTFDGAAHGITVSAEGATITYRTTESGDYNLAENPTYINVGTYTVYYKASKAGSDDVTGSKTVTITKKDLTITAMAQSITQGGSIATGVDQVEASGLVAGDALTAITLTPSTSEVTTTGTITPSEAATTKGATNYNITYNTGNLTITAAAPATHTLTVGVDDSSHGSVAITVNSSAADSGVAVAEGATVSVSATANPGYTFKNWGSNELTSNPYQFTMGTLNVSLTATFEETSAETEQYVSAAQTWTFDACQQNEEFTTVAHMDKGLYMRGNSGKNFTVGYANNGTKVDVNFGSNTIQVANVAKTNDGIQGPENDNTKASIISSTRANGATPMLAFNATVSGKVYAVISPVADGGSGKGRVYFGDNVKPTNISSAEKTLSSAATQYVLEYESTTKGTYYVGATVAAKYYAIKFVPTHKVTTSVVPPIGTSATATVTVKNGTATVGADTYVEEGKTLTVEVSDITSGYEVDKVEMNTTDITSSLSDSKYSFTMPVTTSDVTVKVTLKASATTATTYGITKGETSNGSFTVTVDGNAVTEAAANAEVTITATPASDSYEVDAVTVKDADNGDVAVSGTGNTRTFTMPAKAVIVTVTFKAKSSTPVAGDYWNVNDVTVGTKYTTLAQLDDAWVHVKNGREAEIKSESGSGSFSNNVAYSVSKFLLIQGGADYNSGVTTDNIENAATSRLSANGTTLDRDYLAMDVSQPGTLYVIYKPNSAASERNVYVGFQKASDNTYSKNSKDATSAGFTELTHTADAAGTFYIYGSIAVKIYAVMFVPSGTSYALTTVVDPAEAGSITRKFNNQETTASQYASGSSVSLTATVTPGAAYEFTKWTNEGGTQLSTDNPYTVTMDEAKTVKAVFSAVTSYTLTATANPTAGGTIITKIGTDVTEATSFSENTVLTLTAKHKAGYKFTGWSGASTSTDPTISLTMNGDKTLTANFEAVDVYGTYDFKTWASSNVTSSTGLVTVTWDEGDLVADGNTMTLNNAFTAGGNVKIRNNGSSTGLIMQDNAHDNLKLNALTEGNWFKISCSEGALKFASTNVKKLGATANVTTDDYVVSDEIYVVTSGTGVDLTFGGVKYFTGSGSHSYIYTIQVSNAAIPPSVVFKEFSGDNAVYTVTYDATSTLYYKLPGASDYTSTTEGTESGGMKTIDLTATESGTLEVYSKKNGVDTEHVTVAVSLVKNVTLTLDETASDNTKKVYKVTGFKGGQTLYFQRPQDTKVNSTTNKVESGVATYTDDNPYTLTATDNGELTYYVKENGVESQHATITINTIIARPNAALKTLGEEKSVYTLTFKTGNTVTYKVPGGSDKTVSEGNSLDIDIPQSGQLIAYATMGSLKSDSLKTNVYVKTPSIVANGKYDFALLKDKIADYVLGTRPGEEVTVGDLMLKKPDDVVENTLNRFAFTARYTEKASNGTDRQRDTDWRLLSAGRLRANKGTVADTMAILNLTKGQYLSIEYSGADLKYMSQSTAKLAEGTDVLKSKQAYEILSDGALLLVVPANADKTCDIFVIEVAGDETVTAPTLEARTENGAVVPNAVTLRLGTSNFGNTVTAYYTTDGSTPAANNGTAMTASGKITVDVSCTIKAICISSSGVKSSIAEYKIDLTQAGQSPAAVYNFADMVAKGDTLQFSKTATSTVYNMEKSGSTWEVKGRSDFYRVTNLDSNNKISVRVGSGSLTYDTTAGTLQLKRAMAIHDLGVGDEVVIMYSGTGSLINVNSDRGDEFTVDGKTVAVGEEISSGKTIKITGTKYGNNYIVVNASGTVYINAIYINRSAPSTVTRPKIELREVGTETARYRITFDDGARLYYVLEKEGAERRGSDNGTFDLTIDESDRISAWAVKSGVSSDTLTTVIYAPTPAPSEAGDYDFYEPGSELPADLEVTLDPNKSVTVDGQTLYKPTAMTAQTFNDKFAFTETNTSGKIKIRTNRTLAFNKGTDMNMALLNMRRGDIISFDYTGSIRFANSAVVSQDGGSAARTRAESADGSKMVSGAAYVVQQDGNVLLNLELADNAITVAKMYVNAAPGRSKAAAIDFASALEEEEEVDMEGAAGVWCNERDAMVKFVRFANNSDELPINNKVSTENGYGTLEMNGFTSGNRNIAIHSLAKGDTIKVRFSGGDVFYYGHATYGNRVSVNGKTLQPGDAIKSGDVLKVEKVDYLNNYVVLRLGSKAAISGLFINIQEVEKVIRPTITTKANNTFTIMAGISTIGAKVTTCYTTNGTEPTLFNGTSGPYDSFDVQVLRGQNMTIKAISYSETGVISKVMSVYYNGVDLTPIDDIMIDPSEQDDRQDKVIYDLMGRRVQTPQPGRLYIINGKKVIYNKR